MAVNELIIKVARTYPSNTEITSDFCDEKEKYFGICDQKLPMDGRKNIFKTVPLYKTKEEAEVETNKICQRMVESFH